jgi:two-component system response regulator
MSEYEIIDILLVEDNMQDAELTMRALKQKKLYNNVIHVEDGAEALDFLLCRNLYKNRDLQSKPKVVFLDLKLPKVSGLEVLTEIKKDTNLKCIPVVIVTSSNEDSDINQAYLLGVNSYVVKPVDYKEFVESIQAIAYYWLMVNQTQNS